MPREREGGQHQTAASDVDSYWHWLRLFRSVNLTCQTPSRSYEPFFAAAPHARRKPFVLEVCGLKRSDRPLFIAGTCSISGDVHDDRTANARGVLPALINPSGAPSSAVGVASESARGTHKPGTRNVPNSFSCSKNHLVVSNIMNFTVSW